MSKATTQSAPAEKNGGISRSLNNMFHFTEKGSSMSQEIKAGISVCLVSICALFLNLQIVINAFSTDIPYCGLYLAATLTAFIGTLLLGLVCNLPLVQTASLSISTVLISTLGAGAGLTYENLLAVSFVSAVIYLAVTAVAPVRKFLYQLVPSCVRKALPVTVGLYVAYIALDNMGILDGFALGNLSEAAVGGASVAPYMQLCAAAGVITIAAILVLKKRKVSTPMLNGLVWGILIFFLIAAVGGGIMFSYVFSQNRIWVGINPDVLGEMYTIGLGFQEMDLGGVFTSGFDFSAYVEAGGNVAVLFLHGILTFLLLGMYESEGSIQGANTECQVFDDEQYEEVTGKALMVNAVTNVAAAVLGAAPVSVGKQSAVATEDGGRTGLTSIVCSIGILVAALTWLPFAILSAYNASVPEYGHAGYVFPNVIYAGFQFVDGVMLLAGLGMLRSVKKLGSLDWDEAIAFGATVVVGLFTQNIAFGVAVGVLIYAASKLFSFAAQELKSVNPAVWVMAVLSAIILALGLGYALAANSTASTNGGAVSSGNEASGSTLTLDPTTGEFSFEAESGVDYYCVWVYGVDEDGNVEEDYLAASKRLTGEGVLSGSVDLSDLPFGPYVAKAIPFTENSTSSTAATPTASFSVTGQLSTPEFMISADGNNVTVTLYSDTMTTYYTSEAFNQLTIHVYNADGEEVTSEIITPDDVVFTAGWGPYADSYDAIKTLELDSGTYQISVIADGDGVYSQSSDESELLEVTVPASNGTEAMTSGYVAEENE